MQLKDQLGLFGIQKASEHADALFARQIDAWTEGQISKYIEKSSKREQQRIMLILVLNKGRKLRNC